jgi:D-serine deaminase-like pyridoxal phosphate-dependent protein
MKIKKPTLVINEDIVRKNISRIAEKARKWGVRFRPHFKTHHSIDVGRWFRDYGIDSITVSSVSMARYFHQDGWDDITIAFPYNIHESEDLNTLAKTSKVNILIESEESLNHALKSFKENIGYFIKIDVGSNRTGLALSDLDLIEKLTKMQNETLIFKGFLAHAGQTYKARSRKEIQEIHNQALSILNTVNERFDTNYISYGDTPSASVIEDLSMVNEIRPGNLVYYVLMQHQIGSCTIDDIGVALACPVVAKHLNRDEIVIYGGAVHLSKDRIRIKDKEIYGQVVQFRDNGWDVIEDVYVDRVSQEHGIIRGPFQKLKTYEVGDIIGILPVHSCLTADLMSNQVTLDGKKIHKMPKI